MGRGGRGGRKLQTKSHEVFFRVFAVRLPDNADFMLGFLPGPGGKSLASISRKFGRMQSRLFPYFFGLASSLGIFG